MSQATTAPTETKAPEPKAEAPDNFVSFADAMDKGFAEMNNPISEPVAPAQSAPDSVKTPEPVKEVTKSSDPLDAITKRLTGKEEILSKKETSVSEDLDIKEPENLKPEAQTAWARLTKDLRDARTKIKELETKTAEAPTNSVEQVDLKAQLDALKAERDEYESELKLARLESTREYKQAVTEPLTIIQKEVADIAKLYETDPVNIYAAMAESDPAKRRALLKEATSNFDAVDSLAIRQKAEDLHKVFSRRELLTKDVQTVLQMLENEEKQEMELAEKQMQAQVEAAYKSEWENLQKENPLLRPIEDNESWNNTLKGIEKQALEIENTELDPRAKARLTFNAAAMPVIMNLFQDYVAKTQNRIQELEKLSTELRATLPSAGASTGSGPEIPMDLGFLEALERGMK